MARLNHAITLEEWRQATAETSRPLTDDPIGAATAGRRALDAAKSELFTEPPSSVPVKAKGRK